MSLPVRLLRAFVLALGPLCASACSQEPRAGDTGYRFNLAGHYASDVTVHDTRYTGSMDHATNS
jgi:hypothetical protein